VGNDPPPPLPPPPLAAKAAQTAPADLADLALGDGRVADRALRSPRAPAAPRNEDGAPRASASSRTKAPQLPGWMYERFGEGV